MIPKEEECLMAKEHLDHLAYIKHMHVFKVQPYTRAQILITSLGETGDSHSDWKVSQDLQQCNESFSSLEKRVHFSSP